MRDRDDLDVLADDPVDEVKGKLQKNEPAATVARFWIALRGFLDAYQCVVDLSAKFCGSCVAPLEIPVCGGEELGSRLWMEVNASRRGGHAAALSLAPKEWF